MMRLSFLIFQLLFIAISGCSISDRWVHEDAEGVVGEKFFASIKRNKTSKSWVIDNLGPPQTTVYGPNDEEIVSYRFTRTRFREASLFVVFRYDGAIEDTEHYHVVFCDDVVRRAWWDTLPQVQVSRLTRGSKCRKKKEDSEKMEEADSEMME